MKRFVMIILSVMILSIAGCNSTDVGKDAGYGETIETKEQITLAMVEEDSQQAEVEQEPSIEAETTQSIVQEQSSNQEVTEESSEKETQTQEQTTASTEVPTEKDSSSEEPVTNTPVPTTEPTPKPVPEPTPEPTSEPIPTPEPESEVQPVGYSPDTVVTLAIAKCQVGGMITTQENLANALAEGRITQEEYNEYYPYDGLEGSYYSVFVETDLNIASTLSGEPLRSEDAIATYIADMLLLEQNPVFNVVYAGVYSNNGNQFYEFRCLR